MQSPSTDAVGRLVLALGFALAACTDASTSPPASDATTAAAADRRGGSDDERGDRRRDRVQCDADNAGITLPRGFCALVVADRLGPARHMAVTPAGDIFVAMNQSGFQAPWPSVPPFGIVALRDENGDGRADVIRSFNPGKGGSGIAWGNGKLFFGENDRVLRYRLGSGQLVPNRPADVVVGGLPSTGDHISKTVLLRDEHTLFVNIGSASNACQVANRQLHSPGKFPCEELPIRAGVWMFDARGTDQTQADGRHFATGLRNMVALAFNGDGDLFGVQHGRDMLFENWPELFTVEEDAVLPAEELIRIRRGSNNGWPYCYFDDQFEHRKVLAPEYGGNGQLVRNDQLGIDCASFNQPLVTFGAHWAPNGITFYDARQFPRHYRDGAFVAFHGGFDRAPLPNEGYKVMFVPMDEHGRPTGEAEVFADGFAASSGPLPATAQHRPVGVTVYTDGSLLVSDDRGGRIYRIVFVGSDDDDDDDDDDDHDGHGGPGRH